jgi:hypothetical protein
MPVERFVADPPSEEEEEAIEELISIGFNGVYENTYHRSPSLFFAPKVLRH